MKFIGQYIQDFIARFRSDVYLEDISTGTIASGANLGLDSNNKIVKNTVSGGTTDLTSDVTGVLPIANGGTNSNSAANARTALGVDPAGTDNSTNVTLTGTPDYITISGQEITRNQIDLANDVTGTLAAGNVATLNQDTTGNATTATTASGLAAGNQTIEGNITAQTSSIPLLALKRTGTLSDSDGVGTIRFTGNNDADELIRYATIAGAINDVSDGAEEGKLTLSVASHDGETQPGVTIVSGNAEDEVDVTIGNEATSVTTITGTLTMGSTAFVNNSGVIQVATQGTIDHDSLANFVANEHIDWTGSSAGTIHSTNIPTLNQDTTGTATNATKQIVVTTHNFQLANTTGTFFYVPFNNLNESSAGGTSNYWTRTVPPYAGTIKKIAVRSHTSLGTSCELRISKITDTTDALTGGTHVDNTSIDISSANVSVIETMNTNSFSAGDAVGVALKRSAGTAARVVMTIAWEYTT